MKRNVGTPVGRKTFLSGTVLASVAALAACKNRARIEPAAGAAEFYAVLNPDQYDYRGMMAALRVANPHKQVFSASTALVQPGPNYAVLFAHMQFAMNGYDFSLAPRAGKLATVGVLNGSAVIFGLNDALWEKYGLGKRFKLEGTNVYYNAKSNLDPKASPNDPSGLYQDWSAQAVLKRGGSFMVCHNSLTKLAHECAAASGSNVRVVLAEMIRGLLPGFRLVPAGVTAVQLAQEHGWKLYTLG